LFDPEQTQSKIAPHTSPSLSSSACSRHQDPVPAGVCMYPRTPCSSMDYSSACPSRSDTSIPPSKPPPSRRTPDNRPTYLLSLPTRHATQAKPPRRRPPLHWTLTQHPDPFRTRTCKRVLRARGAVHTAPPCTGVEEWLQRARVGRVASYDITLPDLTRPSLRLSGAPPSHTHPHPHRPSTPTHRHRPANAPSSPHAKLDPRHAKLDPADKA
jgi:hypothetical protein